MSYSINDDIQTFLIDKIKDFSDESDSDNLDIQELENIWISNNMDRILDIYYYLDQLFCGLEITKNLNSDEFFLFLINKKFNMERKPLKCKFNFDFDDTELNIILKLINLNFVDIDINIDDLLYFFN